MARPTGIGHRVEGIHAVAAALAAGRVTRLTVERGRRDSVSDLIDVARSQGVAVDVVPSARDLASTDAPQGVLADARPIPVRSLDELAGADRAALLVLDHLEDPHNVGAIVRTAAAAGMTGLVASARRAAPFGPTAFKAASGALERLPIAIVGSVASAVDRLRQLEVWTVGLAMDGPEALFSLPLLAQSVAIVVGAEGSGLAPLVAKRCDVLASIPMASGESLNASVAAAIASYEVARVRAVT